MGNWVYSQGQRQNSKVLGCSCISGKAHTWIWRSLKCVQGSVPPQGLESNHIPESRRQSALTLSPWHQWYTAQSILMLSLTLAGTYHGLTTSIQVEKPQHT